MPLDTPPGPSPDDEAVRNAGICAELLMAAREELADGDLLQASEKIGGEQTVLPKTVPLPIRHFGIPAYAGMTVAAGGKDGSMCLGSRLRGNDATPSGPTRDSRLRGNDGRNGREGRFL